MKKVLFVCTGNTCRSSMAEAFFNNAIEKGSYLREHFVASSTGLAAYDGDPASTNAVEVLMEVWGIDLTYHRSRSLSKLDMDESYLILTMTKSHKEAILSSFPEAADKVFTLKEFVNDWYNISSSGEFNHSPDIVDPYGMSRSVYRKCAEEIRELIEKLLEKLGQDADLQ